MLQREVSGSRRRQPVERRERSVISGAADATMSRKFLTVSNLLSITRAILAIPFVYFMLSDAPASRVWAFVVFAVALLTDKLDGDFARWLHQETEWGKILD